MDLNKLTPIINKPNGWALMPLVVFLCLYLVTSLIVNDFYKVPITVAFLVASVYAVATTKGLSLKRPHTSIFIRSSKQKYHADALDIYSGRSLCPIGQSHGSHRCNRKSDASTTARQSAAGRNFSGFLFHIIVYRYIGGNNRGPYAGCGGYCMKTDVSLPFMTALVIGGAFFGDNLSFISDTTIAATRTQGCVMRDKFRVNFLIAVPAALLVFIYYIIYGTQVESASEIHAIEWGKVIPYLIVLGTAIAGMNVTLVLLLGVLSTGIIGCIYGSFDLFGWFASWVKASLEWENLSSLH